jgi:dGTPase
MVIWLYRSFCTHVDEMPAFYQEIAAQQGAERAAADYIAGMSDSYAIQIFQDCFVPSPWTRR